MKRDFSAKPLEWLGSSRKDIQSFPEEARREAGVELRRVQRGEKPMDWKPMPSVGLGVEEIRIHSGGAFRVVYAAKYAEKIYVLHCFQKKTGKTSKRDIDLAKKRYSYITG